jgi:hypothetical protein
MIAIFAHDFSKEPVSNFLRLCSLDARTCIYTLTYTQSSHHIPRSGTKVRGVTEMVLDDGAQGRVCKSDVPSDDGRETRISVGNATRQTAKARSESANRLSDKTRFKKNIGSHSNSIGMGNCSTGSCFLIDSDRSSISLFGNDRHHRKSGASRTLWEPQAMRSDVIMP